MTLKTRKGIFYLFAALFLVVGAYLVLVTQGMTIDWTKMKLVRTGAVYVRTIPSDASILLDKTRYASADSILSRGTLIKNLLPRTYHAEVSKEGYYSWEKDIPVEEGLVASANNVVLWSKELPEDSVTSSSITDFWMTGSGIVTQESDGTLRFGKNTLKGTKMIEANPDAGQIITEDKKGAYFVTDLGNPESATNVSALFASLYASTASSSKTAIIKTLALHPFSSGKVFMGTNTSLFLLDLKKITLQKIISLPGLSRIVKTDDGIFADDDKGNFSGVNLLLNTETSFRIATTSIAEVKADPSGAKFFVEDAKGTLLEYDRNAATSTALAENVADFSLSPEGRRLALVERNGTVHVLYLENMTGDTHIEKGALLPVSVPNQNGADNLSVVWIPRIPNYLLVKNDGSLVVAEIDSRLPLNSYTLFTDIKKIALDGLTLYALKNNSSLVAARLSQ